MPWRSNVRILKLLTTALGVKERKQNKSQSFAERYRMPSLQVCDGTKTAKLVLYWCTYLLTIFIMSMRCYRRNRIPDTYLFLKILISLSWLFFAKSQKFGAYFFSRHGTYEGFQGASCLFLFHTTEMGSFQASKDICETIIVLGITLVMIKGVPIFTIQDGLSN